MAESVSRHALVGYLDDYLDAAAGSDYCPNGLQVEGQEGISRVVTGVSACRDLFEHAVARRAQAIVVHHGLFWSGDEQPLTGLLYRRVRLLVESSINLLAYHLPLDRHPEVGNNALAARHFGIADPRPFGEAGGLPVGFGGELASPLTLPDFGERCEEIFGQPPLCLDGGDKPIASVAFVSGAAERQLYAAIAQGYDAFVTGEASEWVMNVARESGVHFVAAGHYATERLGIQALGRHVKDTFGLDVEFFDVPNPV